MRGGAFSVIPLPPMADSAPASPRLSDPSGHDPLLEELRTHAHRGPLGALALDVLGRQAEGRTQFVGREHVKRRAADLGVERDASKTSLCNVLDLFERGAETERERRVVASLAVLGLEDAMARDAAGAPALLERAIRHAVWLEVSTDVSWLRALATETEGELQARVAAEMAQRVVDSSVGPSHREPRDRARAVALVAALAASPHAAARTQLEGLARHASLDAVVAAAARGLVGGEPHRAEHQLEGPAAPSAPTGVWAVVRWLSGWALVVGALRALLALLGRERTVGLSLVGKELRIEESGGVLGTATEGRTSTVPLSAVLAASRARRHQGAVLYAGALAVGVGVLAGGWLAFDGLRSGELVIASLGAALMVGGVAADLLAAWLTRRPREGAEVELVLPRGRVVRLIASSASSADAFLEAMRARSR
jgi:hypothetical protein